MANSKAPEALVPGKWYAIGFERYSLTDEPAMQWGEILQYLGNGQWADDNGEPVESLFDPELQMSVAMDAADAYQAQS